MRRQALGGVGVAKGKGQTALYNKREEHDLQGHWEERGRGNLVEEQSGKPHPQDVTLAVTLPVFPVKQLPLLRGRLLEGIVFLAALTWGTAETTGAQASARHRGDNEMWPRVRQGMGAGRR